MGLTSFDLSRYSQGTRLRSDMVLKYLMSVKPGKTLEIGSGAGVYASRMSAMAIDLYSFDISQKLVALASAHAEGCEFFVADVQKLPLKDEIFDIVVATDVLEHIGDPGSAINNISRVLKNSSGIVAITIPSKEWDYIYRLFSLDKSDLGHRYLYDLEEARGLFEDNGFDFVLARKIQSVVSAFFDVLIVKLSIIFYGKDKVINSEMAIETASSNLLSIPYIVLNAVLYPIMKLFDFILPDYFKAEYFMVFRKKA